ncbi:DUF5009 domain-containing protein [uncultured Bacteroides sp.]|uniref:DUF5009 domain-containing protein n=1 Tax=uncultured Bacteroides sp. TaxID=162156 RepID=UPI002AA951D1|nr:DUF5009 domain-containing protein [uncultured Bacteroides sp.]
MNNRAFSLDALRGYAIATMILSATICEGILPGWMYHAQVPPPDHVFNPSIYGITWVDLIFPFFLFAMGAAFPFSIGRKREKGTGILNLALHSLLRGVKLTFFAIFIQHMYLWGSVSSESISTSLSMLLVFVLMNCMFVRFPWEMPKWTHLALEFAAYVIGITLLLFVSYPEGYTFDPTHSDIIILILANMAIFGSLAYLFTLHNRWARIAILPFVMGIFLSSSTEGSWAKMLMHYSPASWMYQFTFLKYLFIVIPGSIAGEYLYDWIKKRKEEVSGRISHKRLSFVLLISVGIIVFNLYGLYTRSLLLNLAGTVILLILLGYLLKADGNDMRFWRKLYVAGSYLLMLGLFFEAFEGGIRKDYATYSYYFVTSGLAFLAMIAFSIMSDIYRWKKLTLPLEMVGQNPMIAYVAANLVVMPILHLLGLAGYLSLFCQNAWLGFLRGVVVTALAMLVAMLFTKIKWFWRT